MYYNINGKNYKLIEVSGSQNNIICNSISKSKSKPIKRTVTFNIFNTSKPGNPIEPCNPMYCDPVPIDPTDPIIHSIIRLFDDDPGVTAHGGADPSDVDDQLQPSENDEPAQPPERDNPGGASPGGGSSGGSNTGGGSSSGHIDHIGNRHKIDIIVNYYR